MYIPLLVFREELSFVFLIKVFQSRFLLSICLDSSHIDMDYISRCLFRKALSSKKVVAKDLNSGDETRALSLGHEA